MAETTITLPSGKVAVIQPFKGKHIRQAQKIAGGDEDKMMFALIAITTTLDGVAVVMEDIDEMEGKDVLKLMGAFSGNL